MRGMRPTSSKLPPDPPNLDEAMRRSNTITLTRTQLDGLIQDAVQKAMAQRDEDEDIARWSRPVEC